MLCLLVQSIFLGTRMNITPSVTSGWGMPGGARIFGQNWPDNHKAPAELQKWHSESSLLGTKGERVQPVCSPEQTIKSTAKVKLYSGVGRGQRSSAMQLGAESSKCQTTVRACMSGAALGAWSNNLYRPARHAYTRCLLPS